MAPFYRHAKQISLRLVVLFQISLLRRMEKSGKQDNRDNRAKYTVLERLTTNPYAPWCWNIYQHSSHKWPSHVGKYTIHGDYMEHIGRLKLKFNLDHNLRKRGVLWVWSDRLGRVLDYWLVNG